jgi:tetratricopeptide (TPR) repeat protein
MPAIPARLLELAPAERLRLEGWLAEFEEAWDADRLAARVERLPPPGQPLRLPALIELVKIDLERNWQRGRHLTLADYLTRYPELGPAGALPPDLVQVAEEVCRRFGQAPATQLVTPGGAATGPEPPAPPAAGAVPCVAGYDVLGKLGQGGMGAVYRARHLRLNRVVALKVVGDAPNAPPEALVRFRQEAEMTARLQHPNIVQIYEVGEYAGGSYLALEYVDGPTLGRHVGGAPQPPRAAARLVEALARAVHYAHGRGVIHRDLKPANVLLTEAGVPKVTDFGLARPVAVESGLTTAGAVLGTPSYMAPEQADGRLHDIGPHSDVYALGAILYECLTGRPPFRGATVLDTLAQVRHQEPVPPHRLLGPDRRACPADLETICLKCLQKEPAKRYASAAALADDLGRFLSGKPIQARPVGWAEHAWRWARRNPGWATALATAAALLLTAVGALALGLAAVERERQRTAAAREQAEENFAQAKDAVDQYLTAVTGDRRLNEQDFFALRKKLLATAVPFYERFARAKTGDPQQEAARGRAYWRLAFVRGAMGEKEAALADYERMRGVFAQLAADFPAEPEYRQALATSHNNLGSLLQALGRWPEAEAAYRRALDLRAQLAADFPAVAAYRQDLASSHGNLGVLLEALGRRPEAAAECRRALGLQAQLAADFPGEPAYRQALAKHHNNLGLVLQALGKWPEAEAECRRALALQARLAADFPAEPTCRQELAHTHNSLGTLLTDLGKRSEAEAEFRRAIALQEKLASDFPTVPAYRQDLSKHHNNLGKLLRFLGRGPEAEVVTRRAIALQERLAADFPGVPAYRQELAKSHGNLGLVLQALGRGPEAEAEYRRDIALQEQLAADFPAVPDYAMELAAGCCNLGHLVRDRGEPAASLAWYARACAALRPVLAKEPGLALARRFLRNTHWGRAEALERLGRHAEAVADWEQARALNDDRPYDAAFGLGRSGALARAGRPGPATAAVEELLRPGRADHGTLYDAARVYALAAAQVAKAAPPHTNSLRAEHYARRAVELLRQALRKGHKYVAGLQKDADLDALRPRPDFRQLLADLEAEAPGR